MEYKCNAAGRLHEFLETARRLNVDMPIKQVWAKVFDIDTEDPLPVFRHLAHMMALTDEIEQKVRKIDGINQDLLLRHLPKIRQGLSASNLDTGWRHCSNHITEAAVTDLEYCADAISRSYVENEIEEADLAKIKEELDEVFESIRTANLNKDLQAILLDLVEEMRRSIAAYRIRGATLLQKTFTRSLGELLARHQEILAIREEPSFKSFLKVLRIIDTALAKAQQHRPILEAAINQFLPLVS